MIRTLVCLLLMLFAGALSAQDKVTLQNGDVLNGTIKSMADGKLVLTTASLGDVTIPLDQVANFSTGAPIELLTAGGETWKRRVTGIENGELRLDGEPALSGLKLADLDKINPPPDDAKWTGSFTLGAFWSEGNTDRRSASAAFNAERRTDQDRIKADASWDYSEEKTLGVWDLTQRRVGGGLQYDYFLSKKWYALATTRAMSDTPADIRLRYTAGVGVGNQVIDEADLKLTAEAGLSWFYEDYRSVTPTSDYMAARIATNFLWQMTEATRLLHTFEVYPSLEDQDDVYFLSDLRLQTKLDANLIAQIQWAWDYDNTPAPGRVRNDHRVLLSVGWTF